MSEIEDLELKHKIVVPLTDEQLQMLYDITSPKAPIIQRFDETEDEFKQRLYKTCIERKEKNGKRILKT